MMSRRLCSAGYPLDKTGIHGQSYAHMENQKAAGESSADKAVNGTDRRARPRYEMPGEVEILTDDPHIHVTGKVKDISLGGCNIHIDADLPIDSPVHLRFSIGGAEFEIRGNVRRKAPHAGVGIQFAPTETPPTPGETPP